MKFFFDEDHERLKLNLKNGQTTLSTQLVNAGCISLKMDRLSVHNDYQIVQQTHSIDEDDGEFEAAVTGIDDRYRYKP